MTAPDGTPSGCPRCRSPRWVNCPDGWNECGGCGMRWTSTTPSPAASPADEPTTYTLPAPPAPVPGDAAEVVRWLRQPSWWLDKDGGSNNEMGLMHSLAADLIEALATHARPAAPVSTGGGTDGGWDATVEHFPMVLSNAGIPGGSECWVWTVTDPAGVVVLAGENRYDPTEFLAQAAAALNAPARPVSTGERPAPVSIHDLPIAAPLADLEVVVRGGGEDDEGTDAEVREVAGRVVEAWLDAAAPAAAPSGQGRADEATVSIDEGTAASIVSLAGYAVAASAGYPEAAGIAREAAVVVPLVESLVTDSYLDTWGFTRTTPPPAPGETRP